ncbi:MAG: hypothetical protein N2C12_02900, partial [Planctomycetales bacterium]
MANAGFQVWRSTTQIARRYVVPHDLFWFLSVYVSAIPVETALKNRALIENTSDRRRHEQRNHHLIPRL